jgi:hypothetical protein
MNNITTKNLAVAAIVAAILVVGGTFVALQPANAIDEVYSHSTATICIDDTPCVTKICINDEPCHNAVTSNPTNIGHNAVTSNPTNTGHNITNNNNKEGHTLFSLFPQENK